jgi:hypothetical protein
MVIKSSHSVHTEIEKELFQWEEPSMKLILNMTKLVFAAVLITVVSLLTTWIMINSYIQQISKPLIPTSSYEPVTLQEILTQISQFVSNPTSTQVTEAIPVMSQGVEQSEELLFSADDLNAKKQNISAEDRMEIYTLMITKVPADQVQEISYLLEDGFTMDELIQASMILQTYLDEAEYAQLIEMLMKY